MALKSPRLKRDPRLSAAALGTTPIRKGDSGDAVIILQQALVDLGFAMPRSAARGAVPDGAFGDETEATVMAFQRKWALQADGVVGPQTLGRLDDIFAARERKEATDLVTRASLPPGRGGWYIT